MASTTIQPLSIEELVALPAVVGIEAAARAWGMGKSKASELARADQFPCKVLRFGAKYKVRKVDLMRSLGLNLDGTPLEASPEPGAA